MLPREPAWPLAAVVVPCYNRAGLLAACLTSLTQQTYPIVAYELIVVDDGSTDDSAAVARETLSTWAGRWRVLTQPHQGPGAARNAGAAATGAAILAFLDCDCTAAPDWLEALVSRLRETGAAAANTPIREAAPERWLAGYLDACRFYGYREKGGVVEHLVSGSLAVQRAALDAVSGFSVMPGIGAEDVDLSYKLTRAGCRLAATERGVVTHFGSPPTLRAFARRVALYGRGSALLWRSGESRQLGVHVLRQLRGLALSPLFALRLARRVGLARALSFWPIIVVQHAAFLAGVAGGLPGKR